MKKTAFLLSVSLLSVTLTKAQDSAKVPAKSPFTFGGYIDSYYFQNLNNPKSGDNLGQSGTARAFDQKAGTFGLGLVQTKIGYSNNKSDVVVDLTFGPNADLGQYGNVVGPLGAGKGTMALAIKQAYFNFKATSKLTLTAGQFGTHIGYEVIDAPINYNYSLSNLFNNGPFYHIGVKANYAFSDRVSLMAGVVNNVDALYDNNKAKGIIGQLFVNPAKGWNVYINYIGSNEANPTVGGVDTASKLASSFYQLIDLTTGYQVTDKFYVGVNAAYGTQDKKSWGGAALYAQIALTDKFALGGRYEYFDNLSGIRGLKNPGRLGGGTSVNSFTLTCNVTLSENLLFKPEFRVDSFAKSSMATGGQQFEDSDGVFSKNSQSTLGAALIFKF